MKKITNQLFPTLALLAITALLCCCADDREPFERPGDDKEKSLTFSVRIPVPAVPKTYALNETQENEVENIDILIFNSSGNYTGLALSGSGITTSGTNGNVKTFTVKVPEGNNYNMVILTNCHDILSGITLTTGTAKATVLNQLTVNLGTAAWNTTPTGYKAIPMWGEITSITVGSSTSASNPVNLVRMLAKIDVSVDNLLKPNFELKHVYLYNRYTQGYVVPTVTNWNTAPSIDLGWTKTVGPLAYGTTTPNVSCIGEIYTFEALVGVAFSPTTNTNTCLVIGGKYGTDANETFYRVDFANTSGTTPTYLPLLRNHSYKVNIKEISASGYATAAAAFAARPINIKAGIVVWDDAKITKMAYDDQYILGVSDDDITFTREVRTAVNSDNILSVTTDVPGGWKVDKIVDGSGANINTATNPTTGWLSLDASTGAANATTDRKVLLKENTTGSPRVGFIHLVAGTLTLQVKVTQTTDAALTLNITNISNEPITDLVFAAASGAQPPAQTIRLSWMPVSQSVTVSTAAFGGPGFAYATGGTLTTPGVGSGTSYSHASGTLPLDIQPTAFTPTAGNPFEERISKVDFTVNNGMNYLSKSVYFRQMVYNFVVEETTGFYRLDGSTYTLRVKSNVGWKISSVTPIIISGTGPLLQSANELYAGFTGGVNTNPGTDVTFKVTNNVLNLKGTITIKFESTDNPARFPEKTLVLNLLGEYYPAPHKGWAGSNIYWDGSKLTFDDVNVTTHRNYQGVYFQWGSLYGISPMGIYSTSTMLYRPNGTASGGLAWTAIPRVNDAIITSSAPSGKTERDRAYLYEVTNGATGIGDICKYMTDQGWAPGSPATKWRMPTSMEFETTSGNYSTWTTVGSTTTANAAGSNTMAPGRTKATSVPAGPPTPTAPFFPAAGYRGSANGQLGNVGSVGYYWSGSALNEYSHMLSIGSSSVTPQNKTYRSDAFPVRCVREN